MKELNPSNVTLMASVASFFIQSGGQVFALISVDRILVEAPPRSFALLQGAHRYDSTPFWSTVPLITFVLLMMALVTNWKTQRRNFLLLALTLYIVVGLVSAFYLQPVFDEIKAVGYRDEVDLALQSRAATWLERRTRLRISPVARAHTPGHDAETSRVKQPSECCMRPKPDFRQFEPVDQLVARNRDITNGLFRDGYHHVDDRREAAVVRDRTNGVGP
jgi:hypothetical protein